MEARAAGCGITLGNSSGGVQQPTTPSAQHVQEDLALERLQVAKAGVLERQRWGCQK